MKWLLVLLILTFFGENSSWKIFHKGRAREGNLRPPHTDIEKLPEEQYFEQKLDHFNPSLDVTWKQRYFVNDTFFKEGGPVFLMIGGEGEASSKWMVSGSWITYAQMYHAYLLMVEHRFYGKSHPTVDLSVKNLVYLSSEQALADLAHFITSYNKKMNWVQPQWIVMGGSYPGSLAAWMRLKYPHLVLGAVSTSGPLVALPDFKDYFKVVEESLSSYDRKCVPAIQKATNQLSYLLNNTEGRDKINELFDLCDAIDSSIEEDISNFYETLAGNFAGVVQYNKDNRLSDNTTQITIDMVCDIMSNESLGSEIERIAQVNALVLTVSGERCLDYKYNKMVKEMRATDWESQVAMGGRQWTYQTCTEFGFFQTSNLNSTKRMFGDKFPVDFFIKQCTDIFGSKFNKELLNEGIERTNMIYGGMDDHADNVVYVHGSIDPWHVLGITHTLRSGAPAIYIQGTAHCANMYPSSPKDPVQLIQARKKIAKLIGKWLQY